MIQITKNEALWLADQGYKWGEILHRTYSKNHKYYATERSDVMRKLNKRRKENVIYEVLRH